MWETLMGHKHVPGTGPQFIGIISFHLPKTPRKEVVLPRNSLLMRNFNELVRGHSISEGKGWILKSRSAVPQNPQFYWPPLFGGFVMRYSSISRANS